VEAERGGGFGREAGNVRTVGEPVVGARGQGSGGLGGRGWGVGVGGG